MAKCVLEIRDEVNVKFVGLAPNTRRKISEEAKYFLPYAYHMPAYKLGRWDGCVRYCDIGGRTYMNLLDRLIPIVQADGYEIEIDDQRDDWKFNFEPVEQPRYENIAQYLENLGLDFKTVINTINKAPKLWYQNPM